jgi:hypothetical protein
LTLPADTRTKSALGKPSDRLLERKTMKVNKEESSEMIYSLLLKSGLMRFKM